MKKVLVSSDVAYWTKEIETYETDFRNWESRSKEIVKRYKDERKNNEKRAARFNILWSNVQTLIPALYSNTPKPNVDRRFNQDDPAGTIAANVLERSVSYYVSHDTYDEIVKQAVLDRLLCGRGTAWVRYVPNFIDSSVEGNKEVQEEGKQITEDALIGDESPNKELYSEDVSVDYVHWTDFGHSFGRTWQEIPAVWRKVYLSRQELVSRFKDGDKVPLDAADTDKEKSDDLKEKACVYEIWDKTKKKVCWLSKSMPNLLDSTDDPLRLKEFFPCPKPIYATLTNDNLIPSPDYLQYQDQAQELDKITGRIDKITGALRVAGIYDKSAEGVQRLLAEHADNKLIPVDNFAILGEKGGLKGVVDWFPIEQVVNTLMALYQTREKVKQDLYEITGLSDIIRGSTNPNETATAQQIKGQFATLRLDSMQKDVARFCKDLIVIMTEIIAEHFSLETIKQLSGVQLATQEQKMQFQQIAQSGQPFDQEKAQETMQKPSWEEVEQIIRDDAARCFRISIETDSTIKADQEAEKQSRTEFLTAASNFISTATQIPNPEMMPLMMQLMLFGIRGFKIGREIESEFKNLMDGMKKKAEQPQEPDPAQMEAQAKMQIEGQKLQQDGAINAQKMQMEAQKIQADMAIKAKELEIKEKELLLKEKELQIKEAEALGSHAIENKKIDADVLKSCMDAKTKASTDQSDVESGEKKHREDMMQNLTESISQGLAQMAQIQSQVAQIQAQGNQAIIEAINKPKQALITDSNGKIIRKGVVS